MQENQIDKVIDRVMDFAVGIFGSPLPMWVWLLLISAFFISFTLFLLIFLAPFAVLLKVLANLVLNKNERLIDAAEKGHASAVQKLLKRGADPNATQLDEVRAAFEALADAYAARDANKPLSAAEQNRNAQLIEAAGTRNIDALLTLAAQGAPTTPAAPAGAAQRVLARGEQTALMLAASNGRTDAVRHLLEAGADIETRTFEGSTVLSDAAYGGHTATVQLLLEYGADVNAANINGGTALMGPAKYGHTATAQLLLEYGADVNAASIYGDTALMVAARYGHAAIVQCLLEHGADANASDKDGKTALIFAARGDFDPRKGDGSCSWDHMERILPRFRPPPPGHADAVRHLLEYSANPDAVDKDGWTALMRAAYHNQTAVVQCLLDFGADANIATPDGTTALMCAAQQGNAAIVQLLLEAGADANATDANGGTALRFAQLGRKRKSKAEHADAVRQLLEYGANANAVDGEGWTVLMRASYHGQTAIVQHLLECGADVNASNAGGTTALMCAAQQGNAAIVQLLLGAGADANATDANGGTALRFAQLGLKAQAAKSAREQWPHAGKDERQHIEVIRRLTAAKGR